MFSRRRKPLKLFKDKLLLQSPRVLIREELPPLDFRFRVDKKQGDFYLVVPSTAKEVFFLQMLGKNVDVFLPTEGEGLLVKASAIDSL